MDEWLRPDEACKYLKISRRTLSDWQAKRLVKFSKPARKVCLFRKQDLDQAIGRFAFEAVM